MTTPKKTFCTVSTFSFKTKACTPICKLLSTIYDQTIDKQDRKGIINNASGVKYHLFGNL